MNTKPIVCIIGGGPAGLSCGLWLKHLDFSPVILEKSHQVGGLQAINNFHNKWYLGIPGKTGHQFAQQLQQHAEVESLAVLYNSKIKQIRKYGNDFHVVTEEHKIVATALVIATGQTFRGLESLAETPGSDQLLSSQRICCNPGVIPRCYGQSVAVVGGGDNGLIIAAMLAETAKEVHLFVRSELRGFRFSKNAIYEHVRNGKIHLYKPIKINQFIMQANNIGIDFEFEHKNHTKFFDYVYFRLGYFPNVEAINKLLEQGNIGQLVVNEAGYIVTDSFLRTSLPQIYAAGDVANPRDACVATAVAHGAIAARSIDLDLQASR